MRYSKKYKEKMLRFKKEHILDLLIDALKLNDKRTSKQNAALWLFFRNMADQLNNAGHTHIKEINGLEFEMSFTDKSFCNVYWRDIQDSLFGTRSTTELTTKQIDTILDVLGLAFSNYGIEVHFPNKMDLIIKEYEKRNLI